MPVPLIARVVTGIGLAVACILLLAWWVTRPAQAGRRRQTTARVGAAAVETEPSATASRPLPAALEAIAAPVWLVYVAESMGALPASVAPVFEVVGSDGGGVRMTRPPPVITDPRHAAWLGVGVVVPSADLGAWTPELRARVLSVLDALSVPRTVRADQIVVLGGRFDNRAEVARLCRWRRR